MSEPKALSRPDELGLRAIVRKERKIIRRARLVVERGAIDASSIDDDGNPVASGSVAGWDARRMRVAQDMRKSKRNAPIYIDVLARTLETHDKAEAEAGKGAPINLNFNAIIIPRLPEYPVIDIDPVTKES